MVFHLTGLLVVLKGKVLTFWQRIYCYIYVTFHEVTSVVCIYAFVLIYIWFFFLSLFPNGTQFLFREKTHKIIVILINNDK